MHMKYYTVYKASKCVTNWVDIIYQTASSGLLLCIAFIYALFSYAASSIASQFNPPTTNIHPPNIQYHWQGDTMELPTFKDKYIFN